MPPPVQPIHLQCLPIFTHLSPTYFFLLERKSHPLCPITVLCFFGLLHIPISNCLSYKQQKCALILIMFFKSCNFSHHTFLKIQHTHSFFSYFFCIQKYAHNKSLTLYAIQFPIHFHSVIQSIQYINLLSINQMPLININQ